MKNIEQFQPYQQAKMAMQMENMGRQLAYALIQLLSIRPTMALAVFLGQELGLSNQAAMEAWVAEKIKSMETGNSEEMLCLLVKAFERKIDDLSL